MESRNKHVLAMILGVVLALGIGMVVTGCEKALPSEAPDQVVRRFFSYLGERGPTSLDAAYQMIDEKCKLERWQMDLVIAKYPQDLKVLVQGYKLERKRAVVNIGYTMASTFGGEFTVNDEVIVNLDEKSNTWKVDFTGESDEEISKVIKTEKSK